MRVFLIICILFASFGCADHPKSDSKLPSSSPQPEIQSGPSPGRLLTMQPVVTQPGIHYAAYFPKTYDENKKFPVMILFDPQGHPETPLEKYKALADEMGFILMGSHESKNGLGARETADIFLAMAAQAKALPKADTNLVYAGGFSGGGRVASMMGLAPLNIRGILTCGAGVPKGAWFGVPPYVVVSIAGDADMNLSEVKTFTTQKSELLSRYFKLYFDGGHIWPPVSEMKFAFLIFQRLAMIDQMIPGDEQFILESGKWIDAYIAGLNNPIHRKEACSSMLRISEGLTPITAWENKYNEIRKSQAYLTAIDYDKALDLEEEKLKFQFQNEIFKQDTAWWTKTMSSFLDTSSYKNNKARIAMVRRVQGHLSLLVYNSLDRAIRALHNEQSSYLSALYRLIDPANPEAWYLSAVVAAQLGQPGVLSAYLEQAVKYGFNDLERCRREPYFAGIQQDVKFQTVLSTMNH